jgi:hypothetical protein
MPQEKKHSDYKKMEKWKKSITKVEEVFNLKVFT